MRNLRQTRNSNQSHRFAEKRKKRLIWGLSLFVISAAAWTYSLSALSRLPAFTLNSVQVTGADSDIASAIQSAAASALQGSYLHLFSRADSLIYPQAQVAEAAEAASPRIESVSVSRDGFQGLTVAVVEKAPAALVCASLPDFNGDQLVFSDSDPCYYADGNGILYQAAASSSVSAYNRYFMPDLADSGSPVVGMAATSSAEWAALQSFYDGARAAGIRPQGMLMKDGGEYELYVSDPGVIVVYLDDRGGFGQELSDLVSFWGATVQPAGAGLEQATSSYDYIDLRYAPNVFYRQSPQTP